MKRSILFLLLAISAIAAEPRGPFSDPVTAFADALVPILNNFEKSRIETTLRGFIARADSFPGFEQSDMEPSAYGLYLDVAVRDSSEILRLSDRTERKGALTHRTVRIPAPKEAGWVLDVRLDYGREVPADVIQQLDKCIRRIMNFSKKAKR